MKKLLLKLWRSFVKSFFTFGSIDNIDGFPSQSKEPDITIKDGGVNMPKEATKLENGELK